MHVYVLTLRSRPALTRAFDAVLASPHVASCTIESEQVRIRFMAPAGKAEQLVEQIYAHGGMVWCSRHAVVVPPPAA